MYYIFNPKPLENSPIWQDAVGDSTIARYNILGTKVLIKTPSNVTERPASFPPGIPAHTHEEILAILQDAEWNHDV